MTRDRERAQFEIFFLLYFLILNIKTLSQFVNLTSLSKI